MISLLVDKYVFAYIGSMYIIPRRAGATLTNVSMLKTLYQLYYDWAKYSYIHLDGVCDMIILELNNIFFLQDNQGFDKKNSVFSHNTLHIEFVSPQARATGVSW